jgi:hypothetical protein
MADEIINELWQIKDDICSEYGYDAKKLVAHLRAKERTKNQVIVDLRSSKKTVEPSASPGGRKSGTKDGTKARR